MDLSDLLYVLDVIAFDIGGQLIFSKVFTIYNDSSLEVL